MHYPTPPAPPPLRLAPITDDAWPPEAERLRDGFAGKLNVYRVMAHNPELLTAWETLRNHIVLHNALTPEHQELVILRAGFRWRAGYEWAHHVSRGRAAGLSDERIARAALPLSEVSSDYPDGLLFAAVDSLLANGALPDDLLGYLNALVGEKGVIDLMATVGLYTTLAFLAKTFAVPIDPEMVPLAPHW